MKMTVVSVSIFLFIQQMALCANDHSAKMVTDDWRYPDSTSISKGATKDPITSEITTEKALYSSKDPLMKVARYYAQKAGLDELGNLDVEYPSSSIVERSVVAARTKQDEPSMMMTINLQPEVGVVTLLHWKTGDPQAISMTLTQIKGGSTQIQLLVRK